MGKLVKIGNDFDSSCVVIRREVHLKTSFFNSENHSSLSQSGWRCKEYSKDVFSVTNFKFSTNRELQNIY